MSATLPSVGAVRISLDQLEATQRALGEISRRSDPERAHDLIRLRRDLVDRLTTLSHLGDTLFAAQDSPDIARDFRGRISQVRAAAAELQATWPAVRVRDAMGPAYLDAVAGVRAQDQRFVAWVRSTLDRIAT